MCRTLIFGARRAVGVQGPLSHLSGVAALSIHTQTPREQHSGLCRSAFGWSQRATNTGGGARGIEVVPATVTFV